jgi:hypothetical protein
MVLSYFSIQFLQLLFPHIHFESQAAFDFSETETMLQKAEELCGPYVWGIYDILVSIIQYFFLRNLRMRQGSYSQTLHFFTTNEWVH